MLDLHGKLRPGPVQHLQLVHNLVRSSVQHMLTVFDLQYLSVGMFDVLELFGRSGRDPGVVPGISSNGLFELLGERRRRAGHVLATARLHTASSRDT